MHGDYFNRKNSHVYAAFEVFHKNEHNSEQVGTLNVKPTLKEIKFVYYLMM